MRRAPAEHTRSRQLTYAVGALILGAYWSVACKQANHPQPRQDTATLRVGVSVGQMATTNSNNGLRQVSQNLSVEGLVTIGEDGQPLPFLAKNWEYTADGRALRLHLRPDVTFHDGSPVTAGIIVKNLKAALPDTMGPAFQDIEQITASTDSDVDFALRRRSPFVLEALETPIRAADQSRAGTGPFQPAGPESPSELRANQRYYLGRPNIDRVVVNTYPTVRAAWAEMLRDGIDMLYDVGTDALDSLGGSNKISVFTYLRHYQYVLILNTRNPALHAPVMRQALSRAIDRDALVRDGLNGHGIPSSGPIWPSHWALGPEMDKFTYDPRAAAAVLGSRNLHFTCLVPPDYERLALVVKRQLELVNVSMEVKESQPDHLLEAMARQDFDAVLFDAISGPSLFRPFRWWHSGTTNPAGFSSPVVDVALDQIRHAASDDEYRAGVAAFQRAMMEDPPAIFLAWPERARAVSRRFVVPPVTPGRDVLATLRLWRPAADAEN
jgi:peptide/nickel transport system substrate-binding protein